MDNNHLFGWIVITFSLKALNPPAMNWLLNLVTFWPQCVIIQHIFIEDKHVHLSKGRLPKKKKHVKVVFCQTGSPRTKLYFWKRKKRFFWQLSLSRIFDWNWTKLMKSRSHLTIFSSEYPNHPAAVVYAGSPFKSHHDLQDNHHRPRQQHRDPLPHCHHYHSPLSSL